MLSPHEPPTTGPEPSRADRIEDALSEAVAHALTPALVLKICHRADLGGERTGSGAAPTGWGPVTGSDPR